MNPEETKKRIVLITRQDLFIDVVSVFLEGWFDASIEVADSSRKIEQLFENGAPTGIELVLVEDEKILSAAGKAVGDFMAPAIIVGKEPELKPVSGRRIVYLERPIDVDSLSEAAQKLSQPFGAPLREFCPVRISTLVLFRSELTQELYRKSENGEYQLAFRQGQTFSMNDESLRGPGRPTHLFIRSAEFTAFLKALAADLQSLATSGERTFDLEESIEVSTSVHEMVAQAIPELGFTPELQEAVKASVDTAVAAIQKEPKLAELLKRLEQNQAEYLSWHSTGLCYVACRISTLMTWDSPNTHYKLSLASFLHDITITNPRLQHHRTLDDLRRSGASPAEVEEFRDHPYRGAALAREMKGFPGDVDHIIAEHHELPNGKGFPLGINHTRISPLAAVFIVAHEIVDDLFEQREHFRLKDTLARLEKTYFQGYFRRVIVALKEIANKEGIAI